MLRVVNVQRVLENCKCYGEGTLSFAVRDDIIEDNNGTWKLTFAPGKANLVEKTNDDADVEMSINHFSALICGVRTAQEMEWIPDVKVLNKDADFSGVFYLKKNYMMDLF